MVIGLSFSLFQVNPPKMLNNARWIDYHTVGPEKEKEYIHRQMSTLKALTGEYPVGWYYGRISPYSKALIYETHKELNAPLLWEADTYADDLPYWVDVPAEKDSASPTGMLMIPYRSVITFRNTFAHVILTTETAMTAMT